MLVLEGLVPHSWSCTMSKGDGMGTQSPTWTIPISGHGQQFDICNNQEPIDVTAGWAASLLNTRSPLIQLSTLEQCE